jgi:hypothetical protein
MTTVQEAFINLIEMVEADIVSAEAAVTELAAIRRRVGGDALPAYTAEDFRIVRTNAASEYPVDPITDEEEGQ